VTIFRHELASVLVVILKQQAILLKLQHFFILTEKQLVLLLLFNFLSLSDRLRNCVHCVYHFHDWFAVGWLQLLAELLLE
jgi:hypothetical protein